MKRRRFISAAESERNVQDFFDSQDNQPFLRNNFIDDEDDPTDKPIDEEQDDVAEDADVSEEVDVNAPDDDAGTSVKAPCLNKFRFKDLDAMLDQEKYDALPPQPTEMYWFEDSTRKFVMNFSTTKKKTVWRKSVRNVLKKRSGSTPAARNAKDPLAAWNLFLSPEILDKVVEHTNNNIFQFCQWFASVLSPDNDNASQYAWYKETDFKELHAFLGLMYFRAVLKLNLFSRQMIWYHESSHDLSAATMSQKQFTFLCRMISLDDNMTRMNRWKHDKYAAFREFFKAVNQNNGKMRNPSYHLAIDKTLHPFRGRIRMKQYNPSKPAKYGLLYRSLCDAVVPYTYITLPYAGKPDDINN